jgi:hypothetical protein
MDQSQKTHPWKKYIVPIGLFGVFALGGYGLGSVLGKNLNKTEIETIQPFWFLAGSVLAVYLVLLTHEIGHLLAGWLVGMRPFLLVSGPFKLIVTNKGLEVGVNTNLALAGGLAACMPGKTGILKHQLMALVAGGPLTSLLLGIVGLFATSLLPEGSLAGLLSLVFGLAGLGIFAATMFPGKTSGFMTDGAQLWSLLRGGSEVEERMGLLLLQAESLSGNRPRDYSPELLQQVSMAPSSSLTGIAGNLFAYYHYLDCGEISKAGTALREIMEQIEHTPQGLKQAIYLEYAYYLAVHEGDRIQAEQALHQGKAGALVEKHTELRCEAAVLWAQGKTAGAAALAEKAYALAHRSMDKGAALAEQEWLKYLLASNSSGEGRVNNRQDFKGVR